MKYGRYTIRKNNGVLQYPYTVLIRDKAIDNTSTILGAFLVIMRHSKEIQ
jgi:hypothetical protein